MQVRILIADDHGVLRDGLRALLDAEPDMVVVGEAADGEETVRQTLALQPDVVLLDMSMPGPGGEAVIRALGEQAPGVRVLVLTLHEDVALLQGTFRAGAVGYVIKRAIGSELIEAIRAVAGGQVYIHPSLLHDLVAGRQNPEPVAAVPVEPLTPRERLVLRHIAHGYTNRQIAKKLMLSVRTVETHRANLRAKLNLRSRAELVRYALEQGYLQLVQPEK